MDNGKLKKIYRELLQLSLIFLGILALRSSAAEPYHVPSGSMEPTILPGDRLFVFKAAYDLKLPFTDLILKHFSEPKRGDVIVFRYPVDPSINFIKRLIGLPGDVIEISDDRVFINGKVLQNIPVEQIHKGVQLFQENNAEKKYFIQHSPSQMIKMVKKIIIPDGQYFFMGDNRDNSNDSRFWGLVPKSFLKGKAVLVWLSFDSLEGFIPKIRWNRFGQIL